MLGLSTSPSLEMYELAVIGGGPAGLAAAVYGASEGLKTVLIEETTTGGQAGPQLEDRELPRLPDRRFGRRADHVGTPPGRALRRRGHHHPQGGQAARRRQRHGAHDRIRGRQQHRRPGGHPRHRRRLPPAAGDRVLGRPRRPRVQLRRSRRLLRRVGVRRLGMRGRGRLHRRRRQLGGSGGDVHVAHGEVGDAARARAVAGGVDVLLPDPADREERQHHGPNLYRSRRHARRGRPSHRPGAVRQAER